MDAYWDKFIKALADSSDEDADQRAGEGAKELGKQLIDDGRPNEAGDDSIRESFDAMDVLPMEKAGLLGAKAAGMAKAALMGSKGAGLAFPGVMGILKPLTKASVPASAKTAAVRDIAAAVSNSPMADATSNAVMTQALDRNWAADERALEQKALATAQKMALARRLSGRQ